MIKPRQQLERLQAVLESIAPMAIAVSGGVDSMTLAAVAHRTPGVQSAVFHAESPAVPPEATRRVRDYAASEGWTLHVVDAEEFRDDAYLSNPLNRCFHCKTHLYTTIAAQSGTTIVSGTNTDDLDDFRPGLAAAKRHGVRHPYIEAGLDKPAVRSLARELGLDDVAELPSAPCLSSRIETGIAIQPQLLTLVHQVEEELRSHLGPQTVRCRIRPELVVVELDRSVLLVLSPSQKANIQARVADICQAAGRSSPVELRRYQRGSAFLSPGRSPD